MQTMYLKLTESCNLKCPFCYVEQRKNKMDIKIALDNIDKYKPKKIVFHGGEPTLEYGLILDIINNRPNYDYSITTNLMTNLNNEIRYILSKCCVATSYSYDRFKNINDLNRFKKNFKDAIKLNNITLLVTLTKEQIKRPIFELGNIVKELNPTNITLERVRLDNITDREEYKSLYEDIDNYLFDIFFNNIIPIRKNNLYNQMIDAIKNNAPLYNTHCNEDIITINPDGSILKCPNGSLDKKKLKECISCELYQYCKQDCPSFSSLSCSFPKKTLKYIIGVLNNGSSCK